MRMLKLNESELVAGGRLEEVTVRGSRMGPSDPLRFAFLNDMGAFNNGTWAAPEDNAQREGRDGNPVRDEVEERAGEIADKLDEVVVEASRCGMPVAELFVLEHQQAGPAWEKCFKNLSDSDKSNLKQALDIIAKGFEPSKGYSPTVVAFNLLFKDEREMLKHLANAVTANNGWQFGENLATLSKGGWDSQLILGLIKGVFKTGTR